jgi:nucleoside-diphosphate-sugar epimerase
VRAVDKVYRADLGVKVEVADLLQREVSYRLLEGTQAVVHLANHPNAESGDPQRVFSENMAMNVNVFQAASELGVRKIVFASSIQAFSGPLLPCEPAGSTIPAYLPLDGNVPPHPSNTYALSKCASEAMLAYYSRHAPLSCVAIRFPGIMHRLGKDNATPVNPRNSYRHSEAFAFLMVEDAALLIVAVLAADLPGFRTYFPSAHGDVIGKTVPEVIREFYPHVPLRRPLDQIDSLVDISAITKDTGWSPLTPIHSKLVMPPTG